MSRLPIIEETEIIEDQIKDWCRLEMGSLEEEKGHLSGLLADWEGVETLGAAKKGRGELETEISSYLAKGM